MRLAKGIVFGAAGAAIVCIAQPAAAQALDDRAWIQIAGYSADIDTHARVNSVLGQQVGTEIDFESDLAMDDNKFLPSVSAGWRVTDRFIIGADFYSLDRDASTTIGRELVFDDVVFPASVTVDSEMNTDVYRLTLGYSFVKNDVWEAGASLGLHATDFDLRLQGEARVGNAAINTELRQKQFLAPLPTVGLYANWEIYPQVTVNGRVDYMSLSYGDYDGDITNAQISVSYRFHRNVGIGAMYRFVDYGVDVTKDDWTGRMDYEFSGPAVYLEFAF